MTKSTRIVLLSLQGSLLLADIGAAIPAIDPVFEENLGQVDARYRFLLRAGSYSAAVAPNETRFGWRHGGSVTLRFRGGNSAARLDGHEPAPGKVHYITGTTRLSGISTFGKVRAYDLYPGIDLVMYVLGGGIEYDLLVQPGADPGRIELEFESDGRPRLDSTGDLVIESADGKTLLRHRRPHVYQPDDPGRLVECAYVLRDANRVAFQLGDYDRGRPLVIDPVVITTATFGGSGVDSGRAVTIDATGNIYVAGSTNSTNLPGTAGSAQPALGGGIDAFVVKLNPTYQAAISTTYLGGSGDDTPTGIAVDAQGNILLAGVTASSNFPVTQNAAQPNRGGQEDAFFARFNPAATQLLYSTYVGGSGADRAEGIGRDAAGNIFLAGRTESANFPVSQGALQSTRRGTADGWVRKLDATGVNVLYSTYFGGAGEDFISAIDVSSNGMAYVTGGTASSDLPTTTGAFQSTRGGQQDIFLARFNPEGTVLQYSTYLGGSQDDFANAIDADDTGAVYIAGATASNNFPTNPQSPSPYNGGNTDALVAGFQLTQFGPATHTQYAANLCCGPSGFEVYGGVALLQPRSGTAPAKAGAARTLVPEVLLITAGFSQFAVPVLGDLFNAFPAGSSVGGLFCLYDGLLTRLATGFGAPGHNPLRVAAKGNTVAAVGDTQQRASGQVFIVPGPEQLPPQGPPQISGNWNGGTAEDPIATATGEFFKEVTDLSLGGSPKLALMRYYSSLSRKWMHSFEQRITASGDTATVTLFRGKSVEFRRESGAWRLAGRQQLDYQLIESAEQYRFLDAATRLVLTFAKSGGTLQRIEDRNGNALTVTQGANGPTQVTDGVGRTLTFTYTGARLTRVADQSARAVGLTHEGDNIASVTDAANARTAYGYSSGGLLESETRPEGNRVLLNTYDGSNRVSAQEDGLGNRTAFEFDRPSAGATTIRDARGNIRRHAHGGQQNLTGSTDAAGNSAVLGYDAGDRRNSVRDRLGNTVSTTYDGAGNLTSYTDTVGNVTRYSWQSQAQSGFTYWNLARIQYAGGTAASFEYDSRGNLLSVTDPSGQRTTYTYDNRGRRVTATNAAGGVTTYAYDADNTLASVRGPAGNTARLTYDPQKRLSRITYADGAFRTFEYDAVNRLTRTRDPRGNTTSLAYDRNGRLVSFTDPAGKTASSTYDGNDRIVTATNRAGEALRFTYDAVNNLTRATNALGAAVAFEYDAANRRTVVTDQAGMTSRAAYTAEDQLSSLTDPLGRTERRELDPMGRTARLTSPEGNSISIAYDALGLPVSITDPLGQRASLGYDSRSLLSTITLPGDITAAFRRNALGQISTAVDPNGGEWKFEYDNQGRLTARTDPIERTTRFAYDNRDRVSEATTPAGTIAFTRDAQGNATSVRYAGGAELSFEYDANNRVTRGNGVTLGYDGAGRIVSSNGITLARDAAGRISSITYAAGKTVGYAYDPRGAVTRVTDWIGGDTVFTYNDAGQRSSVTRPNGTRTTYSYDSNGLPAGISHEGMGAVRLTRDAAGRVTTLDDTLPGDPVLPSSGNAFTYDAAHQANGATYDMLGRLTASGSDTYTWDLASRLTAFTRNNVRVTNTYDAMGLRITRGDVSYVWNYGTALPSIATVRRGAADQRHYVAMPDGAILHSVQADGSRRFHHYDLTASTRVLSNDAGAATDTYRYTPYGLIAGRTGESENPLTYSGEYGVMHEGDGLYYNRLRYYDSTGGRFLSRDFVGHLTPRDFGPYSYAAADPVQFHDPNGADKLRPYLTLSGSRSEAIKGSVTQAGREESISVIGVSHEVIPPRDGQPPVPDDPATPSTTTAQQKRPFSKRADSLDRSILVEAKIVEIAEVTTEILEVDFLRLRPPPGLDGVPGATGPGPVIGPGEDWRRAFRRLLRDTDLHFRICEEVLTAPRVTLFNGECARVQDNDAGRLFVGSDLGAPQ